MFCVHVSIPTTFENLLRRAKLQTDSKNTSQTAVKFEKRGKGFAFLSLSTETCQAVVPCFSDFPVKNPLGMCLD